MFCTEVDVTGKRSLYKCLHVLLLLTVPCIQPFAVALPTGLTANSNPFTSIIQQVNSPGWGSASRPNSELWNTSITFVTHQRFGEGHQFCKIHGGCRLGDGTVLLPSWMENHSKRIQDCGFQNIRYDVDTSHGVPVVKGASRITMKFDFRDNDVIGNQAPPGEQSLLAESLTPSLLIMDMLKRPSVYQSLTTTTCITETETTDKPCVHEETDKNGSSLNPMIFVDSRVSYTKDYMWPKSLLRLTRNSMEGRLKIAELKDIYGWKVKTQAQCFRSMSSTNVRTKDVSETAFVPDHIFFSLNGLTRKPAEQTRLSSQCNVKVLMMNKYGKRFMEGNDALLSAISLYGSNLSKLGHNVSIEHEEVFFEHSSFHEQVSVMQEADLVIATHAEANSNFMFLRPKSKVFEILPFGVPSTAYQNLSRAYGISYESVRSQPDTEVFSACVKHFNADKGQPLDVFIGHWEKVAKEFTENTIRKEENVQSKFSVCEDNQSDLKMLKECAMYQRTSVDIGDLARKVVTAAASHCHVSVNPRSLHK